MIKELSVCPNCGSTDLKAAILAGASDCTIVGRCADFSKKICLKCNYVGICPIVDADELDAFRENLKSNAD